MVLTNTYNYTNFMESVIAAVGTVGLDFPFYESDSNEEINDSVYVSYTIINPHIPLTLDVYENEIFEIVVSFTLNVVKRSMMETLTVAEKLHKSFWVDKVLNELYKKDIIVVDTEKVSNRSDFLTVDQIRKAGFDVRFRVKDNFVDDKEVIDSASAKKEEEKE